MKYKIILAVILLLILFLGLAFYWWEWRPRQIRKNCNVGASHEDRWGRLDYDEAFTRCAREKGL